jgi:hypothetical protein
MKTSRYLFAAGVVTTLAFPLAARAQTDIIDVGIHLARASDILDGTTGLGGQVAVRPPGLPLSLRLAVDRFFPDCPEIEGGSGDDCGAWGFTVDANLAFPMPMLRPYASGGLVRRSIDPGSPLEDADEEGIALGGGLELNLLGLNAFGEARYEILDSVDDGWVFRLGFVF